MQLLNAHEIQILKLWNERMNRSVSLRLLRSKDARNDAFQAYCHLISETAPKIRVTLETADESDFPAIQFMEAWRFHALPKGTELEPFLEIIAFPEVGENAGPDPLKDALSGLPMPPDLQVFVSDQCPFCPRAVRQIMPFIFGLPGSRATVVDCALFPEMAEAHKIQAVPTLLVNGIYRLTGSVEGPEVLKLLQQVDPSRLETDAMERMLKEGQAGMLAELMLKQHRVFPAFHPLLVHPEWSVRLGAMVVVEEMAESAPELARDVLEPLWKVFEDQALSVQGDILYLMGEVGDQKWVLVLESLKERGTEEELQDILMEALEKLAG